MNWRSYEKLVKDIYEQIGKSAGVKIECWGPTCKVKGKSGVYHQVDVLTSHSDGIHTYKTAIECKHWNEKVGRDPVTKLAWILEDARIEKGIVVSQFGFTAGARELAEYMNIGLVELREPVNSDWDGLIKDIQINVHLEIPELYDFEFVQSDTMEVNKKENMRVLPTDVRIHFQGGNTLSLQEITNRVLCTPKTDEGATNAEGFSWSVLHSQENDEQAFDLKFPAGTSLSVPVRKSRAKIKGIRFKVRHTRYTENIHIRGEDYISWIMLTIFENKRFAIGPDGTVRSF